MSINYEERYATFCCDFQKLNALNKVGDDRIIYRLDTKAFSNSKQREVAIVDTIPGLTAVDKENCPAAIRPGMFTVPGMPAEPLVDCYMKRKGANDKNPYAKAQYILYDIKHAKFGKSLNGQTKVYFYGSIKQHEMIRRYGGGYILYFTPGKNAGKHAVVYRVPHSSVRLMRQRKPKV